MRYVIAVLFGIVGIIHLLPLVGVVGGERLQQLYGVSLNDINLEILMRHRAVLFGAIGVFLCVAAFRQELQVSALYIGLVSVVSFLVIAWTTGGYNPQISRVVFADIIALICLIVIALNFVFDAMKKPQ
jgi:nicotinamide riboside transporter PnuC